MKKLTLIIFSLTFCLSCAHQYPYKTRNMVSLFEYYPTLEFDDGVYSKKFTITKPSNKPYTKQVETSDGIANISFLIGFTIEFYQKDNIFAILATEEYVSELYPQSKEIIEQGFLYQREWAIQNNKELENFTKEYGEYHCIGDHSADIKKIKNDELIGYYLLFNDTLRTGTTIIFTKTSQIHSIDEWLPMRDRFLSKITSATSNKLPNN